MTYEWTDDAKGCYALGIAALRERGVRNGEFPPINPNEMRQAEEGPVAYHELDAVRGAAHGV